jgi:hypothetical protein
LIRDITKVLQVSVFLHVFDHLTVAEVAQSGEQRDGDQEAKGVSRTTFVGGIERDETVNNGLPRNEVAQKDQIVRGIGQMGLDPLGRERILKCLCYHGMDLCGGGEQCHVRFASRHYRIPQRSKKNALREKISRYYGN